MPAPTASASPLPPTEEPLEVTKTPEPTDELPEATEAPEPTADPQPANIDREPIVPVGAMADWTATNDPVGVGGQVEIRSAEQIVIREFFFLAAEAPGVDIRLGIDNDFSDGVGVSLKNITGQTYEGRSLTLTVPDKAYDGRSFSSIGVFCFDTGELFDHALFESL